MAKISGNYKHKIFITKQRDLQRRTMKAFTCSSSRSRAPYLWIIISLLLQHLSFWVSLL